MRVRHTVHLCCLLTLLVSLAAAQDQAGKLTQKKTPAKASDGKSKQKADKKKKSRKKDAPSVRNQMVAMNGRFLRSRPRVGELIPKLKGFDEQGNEVQLSSLKGSYAVIVFGCLT